MFRYPNIIELNDKVFNVWKKFVVVCAKIFYATVTCRFSLFESVKLIAR